MSLAWPAKHPDETLDYEVRWVRALGTDTISGAVTVTISGTGAPTISSSSTTGGVTTVWLTGGTVNATAPIVKLVATTTAGRTIVAFIDIPIEARP
jgi:hypothetical protein